MSQEKQKNEIHYSQHKENWVSVTPRAPLISLTGHQRGAVVSPKRLRGGLPHVTRSLVVIWVTQNTQNSSSPLPNWPWWQESHKVSEQRVLLRSCMRLDIKSSTSERKRNMSYGAVQGRPESCGFCFYQQSERILLPGLPVFCVALKPKFILTSLSSKSLAEL